MFKVRVQGLRLKTRATTQACFCGFLVLLRDVSASCHTPFAFKFGISKDSSRVLKAA